MMKVMDFYKIGKMKRCFLLYGIVMLMVGCQSESDAGFPNSDTVDVCFQVSAPEELATRGVSGGNSRLGGLSNVDFGKYDLRYQLSVYRIDGDQFIEAITPQTKIVDVYEPVTYTLRLTPDRQYKVVVWADFVEQGTVVDLHYNTANLRDITIADSVINDESKDAFFISHDFQVGEQIPPLELKRPFAKLRVVTTDWNQTGLEMPDNFKVTYFGCKRFDHFDVVTGNAIEEMLPENGNLLYTGRINKSEKEYTEDYDASDINRTIVVDYLLTDYEQQSAIHFMLEAFSGETIVASHRLDTDIPLQRNWLTTIIGNTLSNENNIDIKIDRNLDEITDK